MFSAASVCLSVSQFVCLIKHRIDETWQLGALYKNLARVRMSSSNIKGQGHRGQKNEKVWHCVPELSSRARSSAASTPVGNQRMLSR